MRLILTAAVATAALFATQASAQQGHGAHHPAPAAGKDEPTREHCKAMMDKHKAHGAHAAKPDHGAHAGHGGKAMSEAEMKAMHDKCAAMMGEHKGHDRPK